MKSIGSTCTISAPTSMQLRLPAAAFKIAREYLGIAFALYEPWNCSVDAEPLLHDTLCGGVYGSNDYTRLHASTVTLNAVKASRTGREEQCAPHDFSEDGLSETAVSVP